MSLALLADQFQLPGIPATMALAAVAMIGYLVGKRSRAEQTPGAPIAGDFDRALADARQLEQFTDEMLTATREALESCRQLRVHRQPHPPTTLTDRVPRAAEQVPAL